MALLAGCGQAAAVAPVVIPPGIHRIKHVIVIMQENRSFDSYFGTYPGADGIPMAHGRPTVVRAGSPLAPLCLAVLRPVDP